RLHVYRRHLDDALWRGFFSDVTDARDRYLRATSIGLETLLDDYRLVRVGDLASLAWCDNWASTDDDGCGYAMRPDGTTLVSDPDPFRGRVVHIEVQAREIPTGAYGSQLEAQTAVAAARVITVAGSAEGGRSGGS